MKAGAWAPIAAAALALTGPAAHAQSGSFGTTGSFGSTGVSGAGFTTARPNVTANLTPGRAFRVDGRFNTFTPQGLVPTGGLGNAQQDVLLPGGGFGTGFSSVQGIANQPLGMNRVGAQMMMRSQVPAVAVPRFVPRMVGPRTFAPADLTPNRAGFAAVPGRAFRVNGQFFNFTPQGFVPSGGIGNAQQDVLLPGGRLPAGFGTPAAVGGFSPVVAPISAQAVTPITSPAVTPITTQAVTPIFTTPGINPVITPVVTPVATPVVTPVATTTAAINALQANGFTNATLAQNQALAANTAARFNSAAQAQAAVQATRGVNPFTLGANTSGRVNPFTVLPGDPAAGRGLDPFSVGFFNDPFRTPPVNTVFDPFNAGRVPPTAVGPNTNVQLFPGFGGTVGFWGPFGWSPIGYNSLTGFIYPQGYGVAPGYYTGPAVTAAPAPFFRTTANVRRRGTASPIRWTASADPEQQALKQSMETLSRTRPLKTAEVTAVGDTHVEVMYVNDRGQAVVTRVPREEIFFFDVNQRLQSAATAPDLVRVGVRVLVPEPEVGTVEESVAGSREESRVRVNFRQQ